MESGGDVVRALVAVDIGPGALGLLTGSLTELVVVKLKHPLPACVGNAFTRVTIATMIGVPS